MTAVLKSNVSIAWLALTTLTVVSWALGAEHGLSNHVLASLVIILVATFKIRVVGLYFMELRESPVALRAVFEGYCLLLFIMLTVMYLVV